MGILKNPALNHRIKLVAIPEHDLLSEGKAIMIVVTKVALEIDVVALKTRIFKNSSKL
jgi:hypothetical protein